MSRPLKPHPVPVIEALRARMRKEGIRMVASDLNLAVSYVEKLSRGARPMSKFVAERLGFEQVIIWLPKERKVENDSNSHSAY